MGGRGSASGNGKKYVFDGTKSKVENLKAAYASISVKGNMTFGDFKDMVDFETRGRDGYNLKDGIDAAVDGYKDQVVENLRGEIDDMNTAMNRAASTGDGKLVGDLQKSLDRAYRDLAKARKQ